MALSTYTKKPPTILAVRWGEEGCKEALREMQAGRAVKERVHPEDAAKVQVETPEGWICPKEGDAFILENGKWSFISSEDFEAQYVLEGK